MKIAHLFEKTVPVEPVTDKPLSNFGQAGSNVAAGREVARKDLPPVPANTPATAPADVGDVVPGADVPAGAVTPAQNVGQTKKPSAMSKFANWASSDQSGEDIKKFGRGMADAGGALSKGVQTVAKGTGKLAQGIGQGAVRLGQGVSDVAAGAANAGTGIVKGVGDIAAQTAGGITQTLGAAAGGLKHGYQAASQGQKFGGGNAGSGAGAGQQQDLGSRIAGIGRGGSTGGGGGAGGDELADLKSRLQAIDARLKNKGI